MRSYFMDTSALAKRYVTEVGTAWVKTIVPASANAVIIAEITPIEFFSVLERRVRGSFLTREQARILQTAFLFDYAYEYVPVAISGMILEEARCLVTQFPLRTLDAIQLASAVQVRSAIDSPITFVSADNPLLQAAHTLGFAIENPLDYPNDS